eukprot:TRINITY_DN2991_c1_g4_i1.p1 TRINITY_DN2991_c1_g4~~TRINITY_DN2991_c1_g4_i1.p1  ORF type:complete len:843 (+),score=235.17 TRINITY_DN2991_c1_g4_i1:78-2531(+)
MQQDDVDMSDSDISEEVMNTIGGQSVQGYVSGLFSNVITGLQRANGLPQGDDYEFYESFRSFPKVMNEYSANLSKMLGKVSETYSRGNVAKWKTDEELRELVDDLLEGIDDDLDSIKAEATAKKMSAEEKIRKKQLMKAVQAVRPQNNFKVKPDNTTAPFRPFVHLTSTNIEYSEPGTHPFEKQIKSFKLKPWQLNAPEQTTPVFSLPEDVPCAYVDKPKQLDNLSKLLLKEKEFAVDLEHHSMHSFQGFVCLMQISTREQDFIIDALELRSHMWKLQTSFANENIMKVLHGASSDIEWLQRDFGIYIVNMFDTGAAAQQLAIPHGLGKTLGHYGITVDKKYQTADWRQRPLTSDMLKYARLDTHYLLPLADHLRINLMSQGARGGIQNPLKHVFSESNALCLRKYVKPSLEDDEMRLMGKIDEGTRKRHATALKSVLRWRDETARKEDESYAAVLHSATCISLAQELAGIDISKASICKLFTPTPRMLQKHVGRLLQVLEEDSISGQATQAGKTVAKEDKVGQSQAVAKATAEAGWEVKESAGDLWHLDTDDTIVKVLRSDPSKLHEAIRPHVEKTTDKRENVIEHFKTHRNEVLKQQAEKPQPVIPVTQPARQPTGLAPHIVPQQGSLGGGDIINFSANTTTRKHAAQKATSLRDRDREDKKKRQASVSGDKKAKLPHLEPTQLQENTTNDVFLRNIGWEVVAGDEPNSKPPTWKKPAKGKNQAQQQAAVHHQNFPQQYHGHQQLHVPPQQQQQQHYAPQQQQQQYPTYLQHWHFQQTNPQLQNTQFLQPYPAPSPTYPVPHSEGPFQPRRMQLQ